MKKQHIITVPDNAANLQTPLPLDTRVPLEFPVTVENTMLAGSLSGNVFTAKIDGNFHFNISSQAELTSHYEVILFHPKPNLQHGGDGYMGMLRSTIEDRLCVSKQVTIPMRAGETVELYDMSRNSANSRRWPYSDTNRIEISFEG